MDNQGNDIKVNGSLQGIEEAQQIRINGFGTEAGESKSYSEIIKEYKGNEFKKLDSSEIPHKMKDVVKEYFSDY